MPLAVHTARIGSVDGDDVLDVTAKSAGPGGRPFAPSWALLRPFLDARRAQGNTTPGQWAEYVGRYTAEMRASYRNSRADWNALLARERVILVCYCSDPTRCHRRVLAEILVKLGAVDGGELHIAPPPEKEHAIVMGSGTGGGCQTFVVVDGRGARVGEGFACGGRASRKRCKAPGCGAPAPVLCDYPLAGKKAGKTCDMPLCRAHAKRVGPDRDYCPAHAALDTPPVA